MRPTNPPPLSQVLFTRPGIYPEKIPLRLVVTTLSAVQRLAAGSAVIEEDEAEEDQAEEDKEREQEESLRLLDVKRGSAIFQISAPTTSDPKPALERLRLVGDF